MSKEILNNTIVNKGYHDNNFGHGIAVSDTRIVIGAPNEKINNCNKGIVYIYDINGDLINVVQNNENENENYDYFGASIAISDKYILVGAPCASYKAYNSGSAYLLDLNGNVLLKLESNDLETYDSFGTSVDISDNRIIIGAPGAVNTNEIMLRSGAAYVFDLEGNQLFKLKPDVERRENNFGFSVGITNDRIAVSAFGYNQTIHSYGSVFIYDLNGNLRNTLHNNTSGFRDNFGHSIKMTDTHIAVSAPNIYPDESDYNGAVYVFDKFNRKVHKLTNDKNNIIFGTNIAISKDYIAVSSVSIDKNSEEVVSAYIYSINGKEIYQNKIVNNYYKHNVGLSNNRVVLSSYNPNKNDNDIKNTVTLLPIVNKTEGNVNEQ